MLFEARVEERTLFIFGIPTCGEKGARRMEGDFVPRHIHNTMYYCVNHNIILKEQLYRDEEHMSVAEEISAN